MVLSDGTDGVVVGADQEMGGVSAIDADSCYEVELEVRVKRCEAQEVSKSEVRAKVSSTPPCSEVDS